MNKNTVLIVGLVIAGGLGVYWLVKQQQSAALTAAAAAQKAAAAQTASNNPANYITAGTDALTTLAGFFGV